MNINEEIQKATDAFISEKLPGLVAEKVGKMVDGILCDVFEKWGKTAKAIKEKIEQQLDINLQEFDLVDYNHLVSKAVNDRLVGIINEQSIDPINKLIENAVGFISKKEWTLSEINEMVLSEAREYHSWENSGRISFYVEENYDNKWHTVNIDLDENKNAEECAIEFLINENGSIFCFKMKDHWNRKDVPTPAMVTRLSNFEQKIFRLYAAQVKVKVDETEFENYWYNHD